MLNSFFSKILTLSHLNSYSNLFCCTSPYGLYTTTDWIDCSARHVINVKVKRSQVENIGYVFRRRVKASKAVSFVTALHIHFFQ